MTKHDVDMHHAGYLLALRDFDELASMSKSDRKKRAREHRDKALALVDTVVIEVDPGSTWYVQSNSDPSKFYEINLMSYAVGGAAWLQCECYAWESKKTCHHCDAVRKFSESKKEG